MLWVDAIQTFIANCGDLVGTLAACDVDFRSPTYISDIHIIIW